MLDAFRERGDCVVPLSMNESLRSCINALDAALQSHPPTSLDEAHATWLPQAAGLGDQLALQATSAGEVLDWSEVPDRFSQVLVVSDKILPVDLLPCRSALLGTECVIAHREIQGDSILGSISYFSGEELPLRRIAHVCTYFPGATSLYEMDVVSATLGIDNKLAIEHYFYPTGDIAKGLFKRGDLDILHFECHGSATLLQVDNPYSPPVDVRDLYVSDGPSVYFFLGCSAGQGSDSVAATFVKKGARGAIGAYCRFLSGGASGNVSVSVYYDALYKGLIGGKTLGESVKAGRRAATPGRIYYCSWLLFGNPNVRFSVRQFGGAELNPSSFPIRY